MLTNTPPALLPVSNVTVIAGQMLLVTNSANDSDSPAQSLTWTLSTQPVGATIDANGVIAWRPAISQSPSTNLFKVVVTDTGIPAMSATQSFSAIVQRPATPAFSSPGITSGTFHSVVNGSAGPDYLVYAATNLASDWQLLLLTNPLVLPFEFTDSNATHFQQRYYRVLLGP